MNHSVDYNQKQTRVHGTRGSVTNSFKKTCKLRKKTARNKQQTYIRPTSMFTSTHNLSYSHLRSAVSFTNVMT